MNELRPGALLVATHELLDPNFVGSVVLLLDHGAEGSLGVVLNRPSEVPVQDPLPDCPYEVSAPPVVFAGGPVGRDTVIAIGVEAADAGTVENGDGWQPIAPRLGVVDLDAQSPRPLHAVRVFAGYAGWVPGQLEAEVAEGAWWVVDGPADDLITDEPESLWRRVLRRQGGLFLTVPEDPTLN